MKLTYRGQAYTLLNKVATVNTDLQLTYRGQSYQPASFNSRDSLN